MTHSTKRVWRHALAILALSLALGSGPLTAQNGVLLVQVNGEDGPVAGATVELSYLGQLFSRAVTEPDGSARLIGLPGGTFDVSVQAMGFEISVVEGVRVELDATRTLEVALETMPIELEGITIRSERLQIERENAEFSTVVDEMAMELLPLAHDVKQVVALTPGARAGNVWGGASFQANNYRIDGLSANHPGVGGDLLQPSINWIERIEVRGLGAGAEFGGFQGGLIDIVTKQGTDAFEGTIRTNFENGALNASNLIGTEIGTEVTGRVDVEGEVRGPIVQDRLFYYLSGRHIEEDRHALNHLTLVEGEHSPLLEERSEDMAFGKLTWKPGPTHVLEVSGAYVNVRADNYGVTGYEASGAAHRYTSPTWFVNASWMEVLSTWGIVEARLNHFSRDERHEPYGGRDMPGIRTFALTPPHTAYGNNPFALRSAPSSTSASAMGTFRLHTGTLEHVIKVGGEYTRGGFIDQRIRTGGMTWMPVNRSWFDPSDPATWSHRSSKWIPSQWGGEVDLDADVARAALFAQSAIALGTQIVISPGVRWNRWQGWLTPTTGDRFLAVEDQALDPRVGLTVNLTSDGRFVAKAHWGRYHQDMISQMFDRVAGADVFTNEEFWYYTGEPFTDPTTHFTEAERDAMVAQGLFRRESVVALNETGPVQDYRQPYIDQWLVGLEKRIGSSVKIEALYARRSNRAMVALVDLNRATNYTLFPRVRVFDESGHVLPFSGGSTWLEEVYLPNYVLLERLRCKANADCPDLPGIPGMTYADTLGLTWDPNYVLTTAPDARREFGQFQLTLEVAKPSWGASFSYVRTDLEGNLDNVSGYADPETFGAGQYVHVNEGVNAYGTLENFAEQEAKVSVWGILPWEFRGGLFWTFRSGDHYSPRFRHSGMGFYQYRVNTRVQSGGSSGAVVLDPGDQLDFRLFWPLEGHHVYVGPRGRPTLFRRAIWDLHMERGFPLRGLDLSVSLDLFNAFGNQSVTELNTMVNNGPDYWYYLDRPGGGGVPANQYYKAVLERVQPRTMRIGLIVHF